MSDNGSETTTTRQKLSAPVARAVAAGAYHSLFLQENGEVFAWGQNLTGQLGTGSTSSIPVASPTKPVGLPPIKAIAAGQTHSLALDTNGEVWAWGKNDFGQVGLGTVGGTVTTPMRVSGLSGIQAISANGNFSFALTHDGRLWGWGQNASGQVGTGAASTAEPTPRQVSSLPTIRAVAAGHNHALALDADGKVWTWGKNDFGQLGTGSTTPGMVLVPTVVTTLPRAKAIAAGAAHSLAIDEQFGNVWGWGQNSSGQVGNGATSTTPVLTPTAVPGVFAATHVSAGHAFSLAIISNGSVKAWGLNASGQLGRGTPGGASGAQADATGLTAATAIAAGYHHAVAVHPGCPVWTWGNNGQGQLGTGTYTTTPTSAPVTTLIFNTYYFDGDMDGFGDEYIALEACLAPDGYVEDVDCDDFTSTTYPGAPEQCNGVDDNCDTVADEGDPGGGDECATGLLGVCAKGTNACTQGSVVCVQNQTASSEQCDSLDNDCDGEVDDGNPGGLQDCATGGVGSCGEGVTYCTHGVVECVQRYGPSTEVCDDRDNDCNGQTDDGLPFQTWYQDLDRDDYGVATQSVLACARPANHTAQAGDCDDTRASFNPAATESCDGLDNNCDGQVDEGLTRQTWYRDADGDGYGSASDTLSDCRQSAGYVAAAGDCNDDNAAIKPGATEVCDGADNDCDAQTDEGMLSTFYRDADGDGYGSASQSTQACSAPAGFVTNTQDCNDGSADIRPGASEVCDSVDNNCNGSVDEGVQSRWYRDLDGDGFGGSSSTYACAQPGGYVSNNTDCDDTRANRYPGATEVCDGLDNNCNAQVDEGVKLTFYRDRDGDGVGLQSSTQESCTRPSGYTTSMGDCNDNDATIYPGAAEACDGKDNNCSGAIDEGIPLQTWYRDFDSDGAGNPADSVQNCRAPYDYVANATDCNDNDYEIRPGRREWCDGVDNNCDGSVDEGVSTTYYQDADGDSYGSAAAPVQACSRPIGYVTNSRDCHDGNASIRPGASEVCDSLDNNCNGSVDEGVMSTWYRDADGDNYGSASTSTQACAQPAGYVTNASDCHDGNASIRPGASEVCDTMDNNCNGSIDEGVATTYYLDADGDGFGDAGYPVQACGIPAGYSWNSVDCDDGTQTISPGNAEQCYDGVDNDCSGVVDDCYIPPQCPIITPYPCMPDWLTGDPASQSEHSERPASFSRSE